MASIIVDAETGRANGVLSAMPAKQQDECRKEATPYINSPKHIQVLKENFPLWLSFSVRDLIAAVSRRRI
jgi:hypothetical protein